jgi:hypothetical protein
MGINCLLPLTKSLNLPGFVILKSFEQVLCESSISNDFTHFVLFLPVTFSAIPANCEQQSMNGNLEKGEGIFPFSWFQSPPIFFFFLKKYFFSKFYF